MKELIKRGGVLLALSLFLFASPALAYITYVHVDNSLLSGATITVFSQAGAPAQNSSQTLVQGTNYTVEENVTYDGHDCRRYSLLNIPNNKAYLLLVKSGQYAVAGPFAAGTTAPTYHYVGALTYYKTGNPDAPGSLAITSGYETAKATWTLNDAADGTGFKYDGVILQVATDSNFAQLVVPASGGGLQRLVTSTTITPAVLQYAMGKLVDGRELLTDEDGVDYWFRVRGTVAGGFQSSWSSGQFTTLPVGGGTAGSFSRVRLFLAPASQTHINTFCLPFDPAKGINETDLTASCATIGELITAINTKTGSDNVTVFGWWDNATQQHVGIVSLSQQLVTGPYTFSEIIAMPVEQDKAYQVTVLQEVTLNLEGQL